MRQQIKKLITRPELFFLFTASLFGLISAFFMPILMVPDEYTHFRAEYAIFSKDGAVPESALPSVKNQDIKASIKNETYYKYFTETNDIYSKNITINISTDLSNVYGQTAKAGVYDITHLPQAVGIAIGRMIHPSIGFMVLMGHIMNILVYVVALYFIIKHLRYGKWIFIFVACLPMMIQQAGSLSYDAVNLIAIFAWCAFIVNLAVQKRQIKRKQIFTGAFLAALLLLSKPNNIFLLLLIFALPKRYVTDSAIYKYVRSNSHWKLIKYVFIFAAIAIAILATYVIFIKLLGGHEFHPKQLASVLLNTYFWGDQLGLIDVTVNGIIGYFGIFYYHIPFWAVIFAFSAFTLVLLHEKLPNVSARYALISGSIFFGSILVISIGMYYNWAMQPFRLGPGASVTDGIQGRYITPLLILLFPTFAYLQKYISISTKNKLLIPYLSATTTTLLLLFYTVQTWHYFWH